MTSREKRVLISQARDLPARRIIGKAGLSEAVIVQLRGLLEHAPLIKVRLPKDDAEAVQSLADSIAQSVPCLLIERRGFTAVFHRTDAAGPRPGDTVGANDSEMD